MLGKRRQVEEQRWDKGGKSLKEPCKVQKGCDYHFLVGESKTQGGEVTYLRSHSSPVAEMGLKLRLQTPRL